MEVFNNWSSTGLEQARSWAMQFVHWFTLFWEWTFLIDIAGLTLAVIGLFNLGPRLQRWSETVVDYAQYYERYTMTDIRALWPITRSWWYVMKEGVIELSEWIWVIPFAFFIGGEWAMLWGFLTGLPLWIWPCAIACYPVFAMVVWFAIHFLSGVSSIMLADILWRLCAIINYPPSGFIGGLGLTITTLSIIFNRI